MDRATRKRYLIAAAEASAKNSASELDENAQPAGKHRVDGRRPRETPRRGDSAEKRVQTWASAARANVEFHAIDALLERQLGYREAMELVRERSTRDYLVALMTVFAGNVSRAAVARESLHRLLKKHDLEPEAYRPM